MSPMRCASTKPATCISSRCATTSCGASTRTRRRSRPSRGPAKPAIQVTASQRAAPCSTNRTAYNSTHADLYISDILNHRIRRVDAASGIISTFGGTGAREGTADRAKVSETPLHGPRAIDFDANGDMWIALREGNAVYRVDMKTGIIHHVAGTGKRGLTTKTEVAKR